MDGKQRIALLTAVLACALASGCFPEAKPYGQEERLGLPGEARQVWAVAPVVNLSGQRTVDPLLQADLLYQQLQQVQGLTVIPVNRVAEVYAGLRIARVQSEQQAAAVCQALGCDGLVVAAVSLYDPYDPPKFGGSVTLLGRRGAGTSAKIDPRELARQSAPKPGEAMPIDGGFLQAVGMFDAAAGSTREAALRYAEGRHEPAGPYGARQVLVEMDRFSGFAYHSLVRELLEKFGQTHGARAR